MKAGADDRGLEAGDGGLAGRIYYTLLTLAALAFVGWLAYWNLWLINA